MRTSVGIVFVALSALVGWAILACLAALPGAVGESTREPEDVVLLAFWLAVTAVLGVLWSAGAMQALGRVGRSSRAIEYGAAGVVTLLGLAIILVGAATDTDRFLVLVGVLIVGSAVAYTVLRRGEHTPANPALQPPPPSQRG